MNPQDILQFWFIETEQKQWFIKDTAFDADVKDRFSDVHSLACQSGLWQWRTSNDGCLAEIIILDQFSRNIYRDTPQAFAQDGLALSLAQTAVQKGIDKAFPVEQRAFFYLPFMHSELESVHKIATQLYANMGVAMGIEFEKKHFDVIKEFGRYPSRNKALGRKNTAAENEYLQRSDAGF